MNMNYPIKVNNTTIMFDDINNFLKHGQREKAIQFIISKSNCTEKEAVDVVEDLIHMKKIQIQYSNSPNIIEESKRQCQQKKYEQNIPKCPTCGSTNIEKILLSSKVIGAGLFGLFSKSAKSQFKCKNCGYKW